MHLCPDAVVLVFDGALTAHLRDDLSDGRETFREHDLDRITDGHMYPHYPLDPISGDGLCDKTQIAGDVECSLHMCPVLLRCEGDREGIQYRHGGGTDPHPTRDYPAEVSRLYGPGVMEQVGEVFHLLILRILAFGGLDGRQSFHDPFQRERFRE